MGANLVTTTFEDCPRKLLDEIFEEYLQEDQRENGCDPYSGALSAKEWWLNYVDKQFKSDEEAYEYIDEHSDKWGPSLACKVTTGETPRKAIELTNKLFKVKTTLDEFDREVLNRIKKGKSKTKGCKRCGSSIAVAYLHKTDCPICHATLYTDTDKKRRDALREKHKRLRTQRDELPNETFKSHWLVGGWCPS